MKVRSLAIVVAAAGISALAATTSYGSTSRRHRDHGGPARHVLLLSVDGLHQSDLAGGSPRPSGGTSPASSARGSYTNAQTPLPSDSFPGLIGQVTGGNPAPPASTTTTATTAPCSRREPPALRPDAGLGAEVTYFESAGKNLDRLDAGFGLANLYAGLPGEHPGSAGRLATIDTG